MSLANLLSKVSETILSSAVSKLLKGAGLSLFTYGATQGAFSLAVSTIHSYWGALGNVLYVVGLSGFDQAISMILSAIALRVALTSMQVGVRKSD
ncbi:DUF2523 family protein [Acinetobacter lactucae]|uniref:DUF2523 family protein n=1 Tax=Acinetobacter lactucae TaxID=1785128 RepID=UPI0015801286|nr:DUF2523 family protein [Acinetobacter lactucae]NUF38923.1 DUF2523 domain-containing protein [Acinetobacter lactucae]